jgi:hypothetical protein
MELTSRRKHSSEQKNTRRNRKSVQEVSKQDRGNARYGKTDLRYWEKSIFQSTYTRDGTVRRVGEWAVKIQHLGRRETFPLSSANRASAAARAKEIYLSLKSAGWEPTLTKFKPKAINARKAVSTVGEFLNEVKAKASARPKTIESYCRAFRTIVADIFGIDGGKKKYDYRNGGRSGWLAKINNIKLADITPDADRVILHACGLHQFPSPPPPCHPSALAPGRQSRGQYRYRDAGNRA